MVAKMDQIIAGLEVLRCAGVTEMDTDHGLLLSYTTAQCTEEQERLLKALGWHYDETQDYWGILL